jgi:hypothetical protein
MKVKTERLRRLSAQGMSLIELIRCVMSADPKPLWEQEKRKREAKQTKNKPNKRHKESDR